MLWFSIMFILFKCICYVWNPAFTKQLLKETVLRSTARVVQYFKMLFLLFRDVSSGVVIVAPNSPTLPKFYPVVEFSSCWKMFHKFKICGCKSHILENLGAKLKFLATIISCGKFAVSVGEFQLSAPSYYLN